jgi:hypothetical protein
VSTGKRSEHPRGIPLVTRMIALNEQAWEPNGILECNFPSKTRTVQPTQPDEPIPNTKESMVKTHTVQACMRPNRLRLEESPLAYCLVTGKFV